MSSNLIKDKKPSQRCIKFPFKTHKQQNLAYQRDKEDV